MANSSWLDLHKKFIPESFSPRKTCWVSSSAASRLFNHTEQPLWRNMRWTYEKGWRKPAYSLLLLSAKYGRFLGVVISGRLVPYEALMCFYVIISVFAPCSEWRIEIHWKLVWWDFHEPAVTRLHWTTHKWSWVSADFPFHYSTCER